MTRGSVGGRHIIIIVRYPARHDPLTSAVRRYSSSSSPPQPQKLLGKPLIARNKGSENDVIPPKYFSLTLAAETRRGWGGDRLNVKGRSQSA